MIERIVPQQIDIEGRSIDIIISPTGCWEVQNRSLSSGYPVMRVKRKSIRLHRLMYSIHISPDISGFCIRHKCDNKLCINPEHLLKGTIADNNRDAYVRGKICSGDHSPHVKIPQEIVPLIRKDERLHKEIAQEYGVSMTLISFIKNNKRRIYGKAYSAAN